MNLDLFTNNTPERTTLAQDAALLHGFALAEALDLCEAITPIIEQSPLRQLYTPSGLPMSVTTTSCGQAGWVSDQYGYRYTRRDSHSQQPWPNIPKVFLNLANRAAAELGFTDFCPDACLINRYGVGAKMSLHQDKNEKQFRFPIVSVSLGLPATFLFGGMERSNPTQKIPLIHGDVVVWGGASRLCFHGVLPIKPGRHPLLGEQRINLTFRKAL